MELWKDIPGYEGIYKVSSLGRIKSLSNKKSKKDKILRTFKDRKGYLRIKLSKKGSRKAFSVHQIVAMSFLGHKPNGNIDVVDHIDFNKRNNIPNNLRIISHVENSLRRRGNIESYISNKKTKKVFIEHIKEIVPI